MTDVSAQEFREAAALCTDMEWHHMLLVAAEQRDLLEQVLVDAGLEDDYANRDSDGRFISKSTLLAILNLLKEKTP